MSPDGSGAPGGDRDRIGSTLAGRYRILSLLGEGAMGAVYLGEHLKIGRRDAIKVLRPALVRDEEAIARFTRGARNASGIRHPNVCAIYDFGTTEDGAHFLAMEYVQGGNLTDVLDEEGRLDLGRAITLLDQAAGALQAAHDRGIIHRDLKPDNIMLAREPDRPETVKVVDFDISLGPPEGEGARVTRHGYVVGTPEYMSPEQLTGDPLEATSDVYSLALVFFRMLTGRLPFDGGTAQEVMVRRLTIDPLTLRDALPGVDFPSGLEAVFRRALERKASDRYPSAAAFAQAVREAAGDASPPASGGGGGRVGAGVGSQSAGATPGGRADEAIPATRVSSSGDSGPGGPETPPEGIRSRRNLMLAAGGAVFGIVLLAGLALFILNGADSTETVASDEPTETRGTGTDPAEDLAGADAPLQEDPPETPPATDPPTTTEETTEADDPPVEAPPPSDPVEELPSPEPEPTGAPSYGYPTIQVELGGESPSDFITRQMLRTSEEGTPIPVYEASRDSTYATWANVGMSRADSSYTAYVLGTLLLPLGDTAEAREWFEEALRLNPDCRACVTELDRLGGGNGS